MSAPLCHSIAEAIRRARWRQGPAGSGYAVVDEVLPHGDAAMLADMFRLQAFDRRDSFRERKWTSCRLDRHPAPLAAATEALFSEEVIQAARVVTGIGSLGPDPSLYAGGLSVMERGDFLNPHIDNSHDGQRLRYRRLNLLYYVTPDWPDDAGGHLELWDRRVSSPLTIHSRFNRLVLMETTPTSWHSVSPVRIDGARRCVSTYLFSKASPTGKNYYHVTSFTGRPGQPLRRAVAPADNAARRLVRALGVRREADKGWVRAA